MLTKFIFGSHDRLPAEEIGIRFLDCMPQWEILSEEQEANLDTQLRNLLTTIA